MPPRVPAHKEKLTTGELLMSPAYTQDRADAQREVSIPGVDAREADSRIDDCSGTRDSSRNFVNKLELDSEGRQTG